jgi:O-antigen ligase
MAETAVPAFTRSRVPRSRVSGLLVQEWAIGAAIAGGLGLVAAQAAARGSTPFYLATIVVAAPFVAVMVGGLRRLLLAAVVLDIALMWDVNFFFRGDAPYPGGLNISLTTIAIAGLYALWLADALGRRTVVSKPQIVANIAPFLYIALTTLSILIASDTVLALFGTLLLVQTFLVFLFIASTIRSWSELRFIMIVLMIGVLLESLSVIVSYRVGHDFSFAGISGHSYKDIREESIFRPGGMIGSPNVAGSFLGVVLPLILVFLRVPVSRPVKALAVASFSVGVIALVLTFSRGGWLAFATSILFLSVISMRRNIHNGRILMVLIVALAATAIPFHGVIWSRLTGTDAGAAASRIPLMQMAWNMIKDHPLTGVGINNFSVVLPHYAGPEFSGAWLALVHNEYLLVWSESGLGALVAFLVFLGVALYRGWKLATTGDGPVAVVALGLTAAMVGMLPNMLVERFVDRPQVGLLWLVAALLSASAAMKKAEHVSHGTGSPNGNGRQGMPPHSFDRTMLDSGDHRSGRRRDPKLVEG